MGSKEYTVTIAGPDKSGNFEVTHVKGLKEKKMQNLVDELNANKETIASMKTVEIHMIQIVKAKKKSGKNRWCVVDRIRWWCN